MLLSLVSRFSSYLIGCASSVSLAGFFTPRPPVEGPASAPSLLGGPVHSQGLRCHPSEVQPRSLPSTPNPSLLSTWHFHLGISWASKLDVSNNRL